MTVIPWPVLASFRVPVTSVPMRLPWITNRPDRPQRPPASILWCPPEIRFRAAGVVPPIRHVRRARRTAMCAPAFAANGVVPAGSVPRKLPSITALAAAFWSRMPVSHPWIVEALDGRVGRRDVEADGAGADGRAVDLDLEHRVESLRRVVRVRGGARLRVAVDRDGRGDRRKRRRRRDRVDRRARDVERDRVGAAGGVGVQDRLSQRSGSGIVGVGDVERRRRSGGCGEGQGECQR